MPRERIVRIMVDKTCEGDGALTKAVLEEVPLAVPEAAVPAADVALLMAALALLETELKALDRVLSTPDTTELTLLGMEPEAVSVL